MKQTLFYTILFFCFFSAVSQTEQNIRKIDSIRQQLQKDKSADSIFIASEYYKIGELFRKSLLSDSAYHYFQISEKVFRKHSYKLQLAQTLYGIAVCQSNNKDYTGSEVTSFEALTLLNELEGNKSAQKYKAFVYNGLGVIFDELEMHEKSIEYFNEALKLKKSLEGDFTRSIGLTLNNLIKVYRRSGKYDLAFDNYDKIYSNKQLINNHPDIYVLALGNYAYTLYQSNQLTQLPGLYLKALRICDSINDSYNSIIILQHLGEYYNSIGKKDAAKFYAYKAKEVSEAYNNDDLLKSLWLLSKIEDDSISVKFLDRYVKLSDSLYKSERLKRDKFARVRFETNKIERQKEIVELENKKIARERMWLFIISVTLTITTFLIYLVITQRTKNKELKFKQQQQEANEEIYNLMLSQQDSIEEARVLEKKRISEELHDGVLGRLFGTRLSLDSLNMGNTKEAIETRSRYISDLKNIEDDIRKVSHELNTDFISGTGYVDIIKTLLETQTKAYGFEYKLRANDDINWEEASNRTKIHIYRIIQESLQNIYKHAKATLVKISFEVKNNVFCLTITDDGSGFDVNKAKKGIGLKNIGSRVKDIKGHLNIISEANKGTTITVKIKTD